MANLPADSVTLVHNSEGRNAGCRHAVREAAGSILIGTTLDPSDLKLDEEILDLIYRYFAGQTLTFEKMGKRDCVGFANYLGSL